MQRVIGILVLAIILLACKKEEAKSNLKELKSFSVVELDIDFTLGTNNNWTAKAGTEADLSSLTAEFEISPNAYCFIGPTQQTSGYTKNDFSSPLSFTIRAEDGSKAEYLVSIYKEAQITSFSIEELADISFTIENEKIEASVLNGTDLSQLTAKFEVTENARVFIGATEQESGLTKNDFSSPLTYSLKEQDGAEKHYTVSITELENQAPIANAGGDKNIYINKSETHAEVQLDGSLSSDAEGPIGSYEWRMGQTVIGNEALLKYNFPLGAHDVSLSVTDQAGATDSDAIKVTIQLAGEYTPIDDDAAQITKDLLKNIAQVAISDKVIFGQEFPLSFKLNGLRNDLSTSDCKEVTGDHPGVFGIDPHYMLYKTDEQKQLHINEALWAYQNGAIVTFDFHQQSKSDHKIYMNDITTATDKSLMYDVVNDMNGAREWMHAELDLILGFINDDLQFPVVFRLFHEMDGDWFWWGSSATNHSAQLYIDFYRYAVDYIKARSNLVVFAWSPNSQIQTTYYPGDNYVDVVGFDIYEPNTKDLKTKLIELSTFALQHNKVAALTETGYRNNYINTAPGFWNDVILEAIKQGGSDIRIAWVLSWFNAPWHSEQSQLFIPDANSPQNAKDKFKAFKEDASTLFLDEVKGLNIYE